MTRRDRKDDMAEHSGSSRHRRVDANLLIPGRGDPIENGTLIFEGTEDVKQPSGKILYAGSSKDVPSEYACSVAETTVPILMPGLWDCHTHLFGFNALNLELLPFLPQALAGLRCARDVASLLNAGFTSVREVGGYGVDISPGIDEGWIPGPHIYAAGAPLSQTAGHADLHTIPAHFLHEQIMHSRLPLCVVDGVDEAIKGVRTQIRRGAKVIKICSTGGVMSRIDSPRAAQFTRPELKAIVEEATRTGLVVAAHAHGTDGIIAALNAGVKTIEHGSYLTDDAIDLMIEKKAMLVATRTIVATLVNQPEGIPPGSYKKLVEIADAHKKSYAMAVKAGVKCALGTDLGISSVEAKFFHGMNGLEFGYAVEAGMTPIQAIEAGTANAPATLGPQAPRSGQLKEGYDADFIALASDPLQDIDILARPDKVTHVWKGGKLFKAPGKPVGYI